MQTSKNFTILKFSKENLCLALSNEDCPPDKVASYRKVDYLFEYLKHEKTKTVVVELEYIDKDYLDDYTSFYATSFQVYARHCKRVHFFDKTLSESNFLKIVQNITSEARIEAFKNAYLGFVVARPLPEAIIGRTVLAIYKNPDKKPRYYPCTKKCRANLFGVELWVNSLEYQEQDAVLAACATVALWSCFHKTSELFRTEVWSPAHITRIANEVTPMSRLFPTHGLIVPQIHHAIIRNGLAAEIIQIEDVFNQQVPLSQLLYAYLKSSLPIILAIEIKDIGLHAITLTGYGFSEDQDILNADSDEDLIPLTASRIDKFFAHDDQIGPFTRLFVPSPLEKGTIKFTGEWKTDSNQPRLITPLAVIIPVYHKIRVSYIDVRQWLLQLEWVIGLWLDKLPYRSRLEWDIFLTTVNEFKQDMRQNHPLKGDSLSELVLEVHPRFIWRAILKSRGKPILEVLADGTDIPRSFPFYRIITYQEGLRNTLKQFVNDSMIEDLAARSDIDDTKVSAIVEFLRQKL